MSTPADKQGDARSASAADSSNPSPPVGTEDKDKATNEAKSQGDGALNGTISQGDGTADEDKDVDPSNIAEDTAAKDDDEVLASPGASAVRAKSANGKRRSSSGVPEHKNKKAGGKRGKAPPTLQLNVNPGEFYWARLKGHPPWPAVICDEEMLPEKIIENRPVTAQRPDGSYREDYREGGKNVKDRTYAIMYLGTYEFSWMPNIDLSPVDFEEVKHATQGKKTKMLWAAYEQLKEKPDLSYFKDVLSEHERAIAEAEAQYEASQKEKEEKKAHKNKRKSKGTAADEEEEVADAAEESAKPSKKRKKNAESEGETEKATKTPKTKLKVSLKTPNGESASKAKAKPASSKKTKKPAEPDLSPEEIFEIRKKQILYIRHKLQKGFLSRDTPPKDEDMEAMANHLSDLEKETELEAPVIRATRINKVLKGMLKLASIPRDSEFHFKERSTKLLEIWNKILAEDKTGEEESEKKENGVPAETDGENKSTPAPKEDAKGGASAKAGESKVGASTVKQDEDMEMTDAPSAQAADTEAKTNDDVKAKDSKSESAAESSEPSKTEADSKVDEDTQKAEVAA